MHRRNHADQKAYCHRQASECAAAASATSVTEVKQAYLDLEQGWLSLAPKGKEHPAVSSKPIRSADASHVAGYRELLGRSN
jgi:hypothetical protein